MKLQLSLLHKEIKQPQSEKNVNKHTVSTDGCAAAESSEDFLGFIFTDLSLGKYIRDILKFLGINYALMGNTLQKPKIQVNLLTSRLRMLTLVP